MQIAPCTGQVLAARHTQWTRVPWSQHVPPPSMRSWSPACVHAMLRNSRYNGVYMHGRVDRVRRGGKRLTRIAPADQVITVEVPEWKIIDDDTWAKVQAAIAERKTDKLGNLGHATRYALSGIARCEACKGAMGVTKAKKVNTGWVRAYGCTWHHVRGNKVCSVTHRQDIEEVEGDLAEWIQLEVLTAKRLEMALDSMRAELNSHLTSACRDTSTLEAKLAELRGEQRNLARAVATGGDAIPELVAELKVRNERIRLLEADLAAAKRTPQKVAEMIRWYERQGRERLTNLRTLLAMPMPGRRDVFQDLFAERGMEFERGEDEDGRAVWIVKAEGEVKWVKSKSDPDGI